MRAIAAACMLIVACSPAPGPTPTGPVLAASATPPPPLPPGCMRQRTTFQYRCSGVPPEPGEPDGYEVGVCDLCLSDADCAAKRGGKCLEVGQQMCGEPIHLACKYPDPACGGRICKEPAPTAPPSAAPSAH